MLLVAPPFTVWIGGAGLVLWSHYFLLKAIDNRAKKFRNLKWPISLGVENGTVA
ncbi:MAG: hypothetical protein HGA75_04950 [Thiobacillus sp.]|nr:hypothetical protein [Thiobacillus sp.]